MEFVRNVTTLLIPLFNLIPPWLFVGNFDWYPELRGAGQDQPALWLDRLPLDMRDDKEQVGNKLLVAKTESMGASHRGRASLAPRERAQAMLSFFLGVSGCGDWLFLAGSNPGDPLSIPSAHSVTP